jgi:hypothetical protein
VRAAEAFNAKTDQRVAMVKPPRSAVMRKVVAVRNAAQRLFSNKKRSLAVGTQAERDAGRAERDAAQTELPDRHFAQISSSGQQRRLDELSRLFSVVAPEISRRRRVCIGTGKFQFPPAPSGTLWDDNKP